MPWGYSGNTIPIELNADVDKRLKNSVKIKGVKGGLGYVNILFMYPDKIGMYCALEYLPIAQLPWNRPSRRKKL